MNGTGKIYEGLTPYEEMMKEAGGKKKEIPIRSKEEIRAAVEGLLSQMTLEEKIGQMRKEYPRISEELMKRHAKQG